MVISSRAARLLLEELDGYASLLLGPGLTTEVEAPAFVLEVLGMPGEAEKPPMGFAAPSVKGSVARTKLPATVLDADGLNAVAGHEGWWRYLPESAVLTPHPGELSRLTGLKAVEIQRRRPFLARELAAKWNAVVIMKGAYTLVSDVSGYLVVNPYALAALATAGSGDVLAGLVAGFLAQGMGPLQAGATAAFVHAEAAERLSAVRGNRGILAGDLLGVIPEVLRDLATGHVVAKVGTV
jgi:NAD(P)H-hydrate epimerase